MSPKSLLRHPKCVSPFEAFEKKAENSFYEFYDDPDFGPKQGSKVKRALFCSGKIYYDLLKKKEESGKKDVAIIRIEQLYPFPKKHIDGLLKKYSKAEKFWVQEEPINMGYWSFINENMSETDLKVFARKPSASPATGFKKVHEQQQMDIVNDAIG